MANELTEKYKAISPAEFFYKYKEIAGFANPARALYQTVRELVENALDATDSHGILPDIKVVIQRADPVQEFYRITVEDNGIGIPPDVVPNAFGRVLFSSKYVLRQTRGMYGLGVKMAVLYGQMTTGRPVEVVTSRREYKRIYFFKIRIDINRNEPVVLEKGSWRKQREWHGTIVSITIEGDWGKSKSRIKEYISRTAVVTPYANIAMYTPDGEIVLYKRIIDKLPRPPREVKPHPYGVDLEMLKMIIESNSQPTILDTLVESFQSVGEVTARDILSRAGIDPSANPRSLSDSDLLKLINAMRSYDQYRPPSTAAISPLGVEVITAGLKRMFEPEFVAATTRKPSIYEGHPFIVEAGIAYGGKVPLSEPDKPTILRYANKIPLLYDEGSDVVTSVVKEDINWDNYLITFPAPLIILVHVCSTKVPFKGVGKESIADVPEVRREIKLAISEVARKLRNYITEKQKELEAQRKVIYLAKYIPEVVKSIETIFAGDGVNRSEIISKLASIISAKTGIPENKIYEVINNVEIGA
ncbi:DNA topoisomerase VI subunit B [Thermogladius sp. 4427co]|uniref:DNA topoisomerase VI subunit B n=1 Tax=Thermogladius sp. 4427co TaxID=3450718 RepID=UPI003F7AE704